MTDRIFAHMKLNHEQGRCERAGGKKCEQAALNRGEGIDRTMTRIRQRER